MRVLERGHIYELEFLDVKGQPVPTCPANHLSFVNREEGHEHMGALTQEVLRALIDRVQYLETKAHWDGNEQIIQHLRMALALHEARVLLRKTEHGKIHPERVEIGEDGHFQLLGGQYVKRVATVGRAASPENAVDASPELAGTGHPSVP